MPEITVQAPTISASGYGIVVPQTLSQAIEFLQIAAKEKHELAMRVASLEKEIERLRS